MKVVIAHRSGVPRVVDLPEPTGARHFVTVRVSHSALRLPEELQILEAAPQRIKKDEDGFPLGSGASGVVTEVGAGVKTLKVGVRVAVMGAPYVYHATQLVVPEYLAVELPKKVSHEEGSYAGQGAEALHLMRAAHVQLGETVLVFGADLLGMLLVQAIRAAGANPILVDASEYRLTRCRTIGLTHAFTPANDQLAAEIDTLTEGGGVDSVILTRPGTPEDFARAVDFVRPGGTIVLAAPIPSPVALELVRLKEVHLVSACGPGPGAGDRAFEERGHGYPRTLLRWTARGNMGCFCSLLAERKVQISPLVSDRIPLDRAHLAYEKAMRNRDAAIGIVLTV